MNKYRNEAHEYFYNMSDQEFVDLLKEVGFEVESGNGEIVFNDEISWQGQIKSSFSLKQKKFKTTKENKTNLDNKFPLAC